MRSTMMPKGIGLIVAVVLAMALFPVLAHADGAGDLAPSRIEGGDESLSAVMTTAEASVAARVAAYGASAAVVTADGSLWTLGLNPKKMLDGVTQIAAGGAYAAVKTDGSLWAWGSNGQGQVGDGTKTNRSTPVKIMDNVASVAACVDMTAAVKKDGSLWMWGNGVARPTKVMDGVSQVSISGYTRNCAAVRSDRTLWTWSISSAVQVKNLTKVADGVSQVSMNVWGAAFAAVKTDNSLWTWNASNGSLFGSMKANGTVTPSKVMEGVSQVQVGLGHAAAVKRDGSLWTWGENCRGQLGDGTVANRTSPVKVMDGVVQVAVGGQPYNMSGTNFTLAAKADGSLWSWGSNTSGQLGDGSTEDKASPVCVHRGGKWLSGDDAYHFAAEMPERAALQKFLSRLYWYGFNGGDVAAGYEYDSAKATSYKENIISLLIRNKTISVANLTDGTYPVSVFVGNGTEKTDPLGKFSEYLVCDANAVQWVAQNIFNVSNADYATLQNAGDNPNWAKYYLRGGKYYTQTGGVGSLYQDTAIMSATRSGDRWNVFFRIRYGHTKPANWDSSATQNDSTYLYAQVGLKTINGKKYWSLYKLSKSSTFEDLKKMHRLYNPNSGEHFYTANESEFQNVKGAGWNDEGFGWTAPASSNTPVYRLYNAYGGEHHYTTSKSERDNLVRAGWTDEGIGWYSDDAKSVPLYREYNPNAFANNHNYTTSASEHRWLLSLGWRDEGYAWYGV